MKDEFNNFVHKQCKITKLATKNVGFFEDGFSDVGYMTLQGEDNVIWVQLYPCGKDGWMKTSPIVEIKDKTETTVTFNTVNSTYKLELL